MPPGRATVPFGSLLVTQELFRADGLTINANGDSVTAALDNQILGPENIGDGLIDLSSIGSGLLVVHIGAVTGTTPTLNFNLEVQDAYGNWAAVPVQTGGIFGSSNLTAAGTFAAELSSATIAGLVGKLAWTVGGTTPDFTGVSLDVYGR